MAESIMKSRIPFDACPLCRGNTIKMLCSADCSRHPLYDPIIPRVMNWMRCDDCAHVFTDGYFSPDLLASLFQRTNENQKPGWNFEQQRNVSARMVQSIAQYVDGGAWLDIGFGNGSLLFTAEEWGFEPVGLDLRPASVEAMRTLNFEAYCLDVTMFDSPG